MCSCCALLCWAVRSCEWERTFPHNLFSPIIFTLLTGLLLNIKTRKYLEAKHTFLQYFVHSSFVFTKVEKRNNWIMYAFINLKFFSSLQCFRILSLVFFLELYIFQSLVSWKKTCMYEMWSGNFLCGFSEKKVFYLKKILPVML